MFFQTIQSCNNINNIVVRTVEQIECWIWDFIQYDLDFLFMSQSAPRHSAINEVERIMAHLSFPLSGIILRHDKFGTHLKSGKIVDEKLFVLQKCMEWNQN